MYENENKNELMENEEVMELIPATEVEEKESGIGTLTAMAIGAGLTAAGIAVVKLGKKGISWVKAKRAASKAEADEVAEAEDAPVETVVEKKEKKSKKVDNPEDKN